MTPLFAQNSDELVKTLRLSGVKEDHDAAAIIAQAVLAVRGHFYRRLGQTRVAQLLAMPVAAEPATVEEILRSVATVTETKWVRLELLDSLPTMFMDGSNNTLQEWDEEAPFRNTSTFQIAALKKSLKSQIEENLDMLAGREEQGNESTVQSFDGTPSTTPPKPGASVRSFSW